MQQMRIKSQDWKSPRKVTKGVSTLTAVASDLLYPTPSISSAMKTPNPQYPGPLPSLVQILKRLQNHSSVPDTPGPAAEEDSQMEYSFCSSYTGALMKNYL